MPAYTKAQLLDYALAYSRAYTVHAYTTEGRKRHSTHMVIQDPWGHFYFVNHNMCSLGEMLAHVRLQGITGATAFQDACGLFALLVVGDPSGYVDITPNRRAAGKYSQEQLAWFDEASLDLLGELRRLRSQRTRQQGQVVEMVRHALPLRVNVGQRCNAMVSEQEGLLRAKMTRVIARTTEKEMGLPQVLMVTKGDGRQSRT